MRIEGTDPFATAKRGAGKEVARETPNTTGTSSSETTCGLRTSTAVFGPGLRCRDHTKHPLDLGELLGRVKARIEARADLLFNPSPGRSPSACPTRGTARPTREPIFGGRR